jgi:hypothetical protein
MEKDTKFDLSPQERGASWWSPITIGVAAVLTAITVFVARAAR